MDISKLIFWVMKTDRRLIVMRTVGPNCVIKASEIAKKTGRSLQNISYAIRELEKCGLIRCITPNKSTWKTFIFTKQGIKILEELKKSEILSESKKRKNFEHNDSIRIQPNVPHTIVATEDTVLHEVITPHIDDTVRIKDFYERNNN